MWNVTEVSRVTTQMVSESAGDLPMYKAGRLIYLIVSPLMFVLGLIGNILCFVVLSRKALKEPPTYLYLSVLAIVDIFALSVPCLRGWLFHLTSGDVDLMKLMGCSWYFIVYFSLCNESVYIIVNMAVDRFIYVFFPFSAKVICTHRRAIYGMILVSVIQILSNLHYPWTYGLHTKSKSDTTLGCSAKPGYEHWIYNIWPFVDLAIYSFIPSILLTTINSAIIYRTVAQRKSFKKNKSGDAQQRSTTIVLILVCVVLMVTTMPVVILHLIEVSWDRSSPEEQAKHLLAMAICEHLMYLNNCCNFILYVLTASKFRKDLLNTLGMRNRVDAVRPVLDVQNTTARTQETGC